MDDVQATVQLSKPLPVVLAGLLVLIQLIFPSRIWIALLWLVGGLSALAYYWALQLARHIRAKRELRFGWVQVGDRLEERFTVTNRAWLPALSLEVVDESDLPQYRLARVVPCEGHRTVHWTTAVECTRRGIFSLGPWALRFGDPFGFFLVTMRWDRTQPIAVYPAVVHLPQIALPRGEAVGSTRAQRRVTEAMGEASQTRYYRPTDPLRLIHWPSTAHQGELVVREPDTEVAGDLWIVLDLDGRVQAGEGEESTEEYGVILAASLADRTLRQNRAVGLVANGAQPTFLSPGRGQGHLWRILQALASVEAGGDRGLATVLEQMRGYVGQDASVLVITPSDESDWIQALLPFTRWGISPSVVLLERASFAGPIPSSFEGTVSGETQSRRLGTMRPEESRIRGLLAKAGINVQTVRQGYPFRPIVTPKRRGHWEFKVTPMGRAVVVRRPEEA